MHARLVRRQGGNTRAGDVSEKCSDWCNEVLYWQEIVHTTDYEPLVLLAMSLGCTYLSALNSSRNAH